MAMWLPIAERARIQCHDQIRGLLECQGRVGASDPHQLAIGGSRETWSIIRLGVTLLAYPIGHRQEIEGVTARPTPVNSISYSSRHTLSLRDSPGHCLTNTANFASNELHCGKRFSSPQPPTHFALNKFGLDGKFGPLISLLLIAKESCKQNFFFTSVPFLISSVKRFSNYCNRLPQSCPPPPCHNRMFSYFNKVTQYLPITDFDFDDCHKDWHKKLLFSSLTQADH